VLSTEGDWLRELAGHLRRAHVMHRGTAPSPSAVRAAEEAAP
jgi:hypothetical protein